MPTCPGSRRLEQLQIRRRSSRYNKLPTAGAVGQYQSTTRSRATFFAGCRLFTTLRSATLRGASAKHVSGTNTSGAGSASKLRSRATRSTAVRECTEDPARWQDDLSAFAGGIARACQQAPRCSRSAAVPASRRFQWRFGNHACVRATKGHCPGDAQPSVSPRRRHGDGMQGRGRGAILRSRRRHRI